MTVTITLKKYNTLRQRKDAKDQPGGEFRCEECHQLTYQHPKGHFNDTPTAFTYGPAWEDCRCPGAKANHSYIYDLRLREENEYKAIKKVKDDEDRAIEKAKKDAREKPEKDKYDAEMRPLREAQAKRRWDAEAPQRRAAQKAAQFAAKEEELRYKRQELEERELNRRLEQADRYDERVDEDDTEAEGSTLADFSAAWDDKLDLTPLPALLSRDDGGTILYASKLNWIFGLPSSGKTWVSIIALEQAILCGGRVLVMDFEDSRATFQRRAHLLGLNPALHADNIIYALPGLMDNPSALAEAQEWLMDANNPTYSLVVIDAAESSGCPSDGAAVNPWIAKMIKPWRDVGAGVLVVDHQPKRNEDRPLGPIGSQRKLAAVDGAALECSGLCWTKAKGGKIILSNHKDRGGDLDAPIKKALAVIVGTWAGEGDARAFGYTIERPEQQEDVESLSHKIFDAVRNAGPDGISSLTKLRHSVKAQNSAKDATIAELIRAGYIHEDRGGQANIYTTTDEGIQWRTGLK